MNLIFFDDKYTEDLLPLTFYRPTALLRTGILTNADRWEKILGTSGSFMTSEYLQEKFPLKADAENIIINGRALPNKNLVNQILSLNPGECIMQNDVLIAACALQKHLEMDTAATALKDFKVLQIENVSLIRHGWDLFALNDEYIRYDFELLTRNRKSAPLSATNTVIGDGEIFVEDGVSAECAVFNTSSGPVYLGKNSTVMEGSVVRGPFALCEHSTLKMMSKIYGPTTIGPHCKVGGEVNNSVFLGYSNKAHDGFLGQAVIGEWCNLGADTNNSNLKNTYDIVKMWSYPEQRFIKTGLQFCGLIMGDHSKCGINTMFNTGTVVGVNANIFGAGYQKNLIPSFSWGGGSTPRSHYPLEKNLKVAEIVYQRRKIDFDPVEQRLMTAVYNICKENKNY
ncbi:MAG: glucose-1-phosphate thymidylyltransferase [Marinilabiliales bacterium]|nr:MAG: glucose-1-phosphate thymidylyltransferase [Marinilabiliales bacterium]